MAGIASFTTTMAVVAPTLLLCGYYLHRTRKAERLATAARDAALASGLAEPASLHPVVDPGLCLGCGGCVDACPEKGVLGLVDGKAELVEPTHCIGHGACRAACPTGAITLVFGTETRGVDIPHVRPDFETNVPGLFVAGELGGMGLIRNAIEQGRQAIESVRKLDGMGRSDRLDVVVVGAGPAGFSASLAAMKHGLRYATLEQDTLGGTVAHYPRGKIVMTAPVDLPLVGKVRMRETTKEALLEFWQDVERRTGVEVRYEERVDAIEPNGDGFLVRSTREAYRSRAVVLCIGRRGTPRRLGVPGEDLGKVTYRLIDPEQYRGRRVLVVGGGDSAIEAAVALSEQPGTTVHLTYRSDAFGRAKPRNRERIATAASAGRLRVLLRSEVLEILADRVRLGQNGRPVELANDAVLVCAGGVLPTGFLKSIGVRVETKFGTA